MANVFMILLFWNFGAERPLYGNSTLKLTSVDTVKVINWLNAMNNKFIDEKIFFLKTNVSVFRDIKESVLEEKTESSFYRNHHDFIQTRPGQIIIEDKRIHLSLDSSKKEIVVNDPIGFNYYQTDLGLIKMYLKLAENVELSEDNQKLIIQFPREIEIKRVEIFLDNKLFLKKMLVIYNPQAIEENNVTTYYEPMIKIELNSLSNSEKKKINSIKTQDIITFEKGGTIKSRVNGYKIIDQRKKTKN